MNSSFVAIIRDKTWRFLETETAQRAARVHIPRSRRVLRLSAQLVRDDLNERRISVIGFNSLQEQRWIAALRGVVFPVFPKPAQLQNRPAV